MIIGLDIDGTVFSHEYPKLGEDLGAFPWLLQAQKKGALFIIFTMRDGKELQEAASALIMDEGLAVIGRNVNPDQNKWTMSPKAYCHLYIDDNGLGMPLLGEDSCYPRAVDWDRAGPMLIDAVDAWNKRHLGR